LVLARVFQTEKRAKKGAATKINLKDAVVRGERAEWEVTIRKGLARILRVGKQKQQSR